MKRIDSNEHLDALINNAAEKACAASNDNSFISVSGMNYYLDRARKMEAPRELVKSIVVEHEITFLFGDTGIGKTILAIQLACVIALLGLKVLYVNFELSDQQMATRYPRKDFPDNFYMASIDYSKMHDVTEQSRILEGIQRTALENEIDVLFIDNFTNLCINSKEGSEAGNIMLQLLSLRKTHNWTMVILAHVPKRKPGDPLTLNDLAGSKIISNIADNVVGINKSKKDKNMRYLIQQKYRSFPIELDSKNVQELTMTTSDGWLHFERGGYSEEVSHLPRSRDEKAELERDIVRELKNGKTYRDIADELVTSLGTISRVAKANGFGKKKEKPAK